MSSVLIHIFLSGHHQCNVRLHNILAPSQVVIAGSHGHGHAVMSNSHRLSSGSLWYSADSRVNARKQSFFLPFKFLVYLITESHNILPVFLSVGGVSGLVWDVTLNRCNILPNKCNVTADKRYVTLSSMSYDVQRSIRSQFNIKL